MDEKETPGAKVCVVTAFDHDFVGWPISVGRGNANRMTDQFTAAIMALCWSLARLQAS